MASLDYYKILEITKSVSKAHIKKFTEKRDANVI